PTGPSPALFFDTVNAYQRTEALRAAVELDLFTQVGAGHRTVEQLAQACQAAPRGVRILADYLTILGFLRKDGDGYGLTPDAEAFLDRPAPGYLGGAGVPAGGRAARVLPTPDGGGAPRRDGGLRRGDGLPRQPDLGGIRPGDGAADAAAGPAARGPHR